MSNSPQAIVPEAAADVAVAPADPATSPPPAAKRTKRARLVVDPTSVPSLSQLAASVPKMSVPGPKGSFSMPAEALGFVTEPNSPFEDGYSIKGERAALSAELALSERDELPYSHPAFARVMELESREQRLAKASRDYEQRNGADQTTTMKDARSIKAMGSLRASADAPDSMTLHTLDALRLFIGRAKDPARKLSHISGGTRVASAAKLMWIMSGKDNPYADWALLHLEDSVRLIQSLLAARTKELVGKLEAKRAIGLNYAVMDSAKPSTVQLGFSSPYGFSVAEIIVTYDYFVRVIKTLMRRDMVTDDEGWTIQRAITRRIRGLFSEFEMFERAITRTDCAQLTRADYVLAQSEAASEKGQAAVARIAAITAILGPVPSAVFARTVIPKHCRNRAAPPTGDDEMAAVVRDLKQAEEDESANALALEAEAASLL